MPESFFLLILVIALAQFFDLTNGFNDAANAIATSVSTRVLSPRAAIIMAAALALPVCGLLAAFFERFLVFILPASMG